jgi:hypothetical protein
VPDNKDPGAISPARFEQFFSNYTGLRHQKEALFDLWRRIDRADPTILREAEPWRVKYSSDPEPLKTNPLNVPYFWQQDNGADGWRQCQTSGIGMGLAYKQVQGIRDDLDYLRYVRRCGDTTERSTHFQAMALLGYGKAEWRTDWTAAQFKAEIDKGNPVVPGVLHHGPASNPTGGGHFIVIIGYTKTHWICNDPYGELDLINGGWTAQHKTAGQRVKYSMQNLNKRIFVEGPASGWAWAIR